MSTTTATALPLAAGTWSIDQAHSAVNFSVRHLGLAKVRGRFNQFDGSVQIGDDLASTTVEANVDLSSVDTNQPDRDAHLRSGDFFNADTQPKMTFVSTGIRADGDGYVLDGHLTIAGTTKPLSLAVEFFGSEDYPMDGTVRAGFAASGSISRADFGVTFDVPLGGDKVAIGDKVAVELDVQLVAPHA
jgi:polyisoprenoid-binding protein YceI